VPNSTYRTCLEDQGEMTSPGAVECQFCAVMWIDTCHRNAKYRAITVIVLIKTIESLIDSLTFKNRASYI
jgi:hypothetical protein